MGSLLYSATFSEELRASGLDAADVQLVGQISGSHTPTIFSYDASTSTLTLEYTDLAEDGYRLTLLSGDEAFEDLAGSNLDGEPLRTDRIDFSVLRRHLRVAIP